MQSLPGYLSDTRAVPLQEAVRGHLTEVIVNSLGMVGWTPSFYR